MKSNQKQIKSSLVILFFLLMIPAIIGLMIKAEWFIKNPTESEMELKMDIVDTQVSYQQRKPCEI